jgi:hypothetical protein
MNKKKPPPEALLVPAEALAKGGDSDELVWRCPDDHVVANDDTPTL